MAAKYLHSLADENPDLQKQIGCITGAFQVFNRHHIVSGRSLVGHSPNRLRPGSLLFNDGTPERELSLWSPPSPSRQMNHQYLDLRDVVKDSMHREARGLSHRTTTKKESPDNVLAELQETNWYCDEPRELSRSKSCHIKDYPRFSYDGRETDTSKTILKHLKELPRLSLDGRESSIRTLTSVSLVPVKPSDSKNPKINGGISADKVSNLTRPPSVVAKLMGLETLPDSASRNEKLDINSSSKSPKGADFCGSIKIPSSTRSSSREPTSPCWKNPISRVPIEPAPWKQRDGAQSPQKITPAPRVTRSATKTHSPVSSVYGEVDKRLKNLEFSQSGKDLRALKQILAAMQAVEARKGEKQDTMERFSDHEKSLNDHQNPPSAIRGSDVSMDHESHIVIMKPAKLVRKDSKVNKTGKPLKDSRKPRKQSESKSSNKRRSSNIDQNDYRSSESRKCETQTSEQVNKDKVLKMDTEINASEYSEETNSRQSSSSPQEKSTLIENTSEYRSPVSVLDDSVYMDDATQIPSEESVKGVEPPINREKLKKVEQLVQKLMRLNSDHDEAHTDYIASLSENTNPNDRYVSEIFLASGLLLRDLESFEFHSSGYPVNPELFLVLEHTKFSNQKNERFHRKLIFDAVNEILVGKLNSASMTLQSPRKLLRDLCLEIERQIQKKRVRCGLGEDDDDLKCILGEDVLNQSENWMGFHGESPVITLEVERLIFRDLVDELVISEACDGK